MLALFLASDLIGEETPRYETHIVPIFKANCIRCHNPQAMKAELDLSTAEGLFRGGESGAVIAPKDVAESSLYDLIHEGEMPPEEDKHLAKADVETIRRWIEIGTPFVKDIDPRELLAAGEVSNHVIEPMMLLRCAVCHGLRTQEAGLDLRTKASMLKGGKSGPAIVLGKPEESLMLKRIHAVEMPPRELLIRSGVKPMSEDEIAQLSRWIELGAPEVTVEPDVATTESDPLVTDEDREFWSFKPPRKAAVPQVKNAERVRNSIDAFVIRRQEARDLEMAPEADRLTLLRRVSFDLTGLPPRPDDVHLFLNDNDPLAYERMVDRLLASPQYGERWGRFWLDAAGYADSEGKRSADPIRPYAWKYRDYVIRAFNSDKPYDRFLLEQIAGDELADYENAKTITRELADNLIATAFLRMAPDGTGSDIVNSVPERLEVIADELDIFGSTVMGMTIKCARCHSHKYDPIPQRDYYRLAAVFKGAMDEHDWLKPASVPGQTKGVKPARYLTYATDQEKREIEKRNQEIDAQIEREREKLAVQAKEYRFKYLEEQLKSLPEQLHDDFRKTFSTTESERSEVQKYLAEKFGKQLWLTDAKLNGQDGYKRAKIEVDRLIKQWESEKSGGPMIRALWDRGNPSPTYIYRRGEYRQPSRLVGPGVPSALTDGRTPFVVKPPWEGANQTGRRLALARWLVESDHPLTARVMVNRIWKHHFGEGIVRSLNNFGKLGTPPTHPELLDWLAVEFVEHGWSIKHLHRLILTSGTFRQSSTPHSAIPSLQSKDLDNRWLTRMPLRRLDAEEVRDSLIFVAGQLNGRKFGRPDSVDVRKDGLVTAASSTSGFRRSVYLRHRRKEMPTVLETFDLPQMNPNCEKRINSTVAQQALYLLNNAMVRQLSELFAHRVGQETLDAASQVDRAYLIALGRRPSEQEKSIGVDAILQLTEHWQKHLATKDNSSNEAAENALATFCHTIMNSAEFLYVD